MTETIIVAILSLFGTLIGSFIAQKKTTALVVYRLEQLEDKVHQHNNLIERTYRLEETCTVLDEKVKVANNRIKDLEEKWWKC